MAELEGQVADTGIPEKSNREDELRTKWAMAAVSSPRCGLE